MYVKTNYCHLYGKKHARVNQPHSRIIINPFYIEGHKKYTTSIGISI